MYSNPHIKGSSLKWLLLPLILVYFSGCATYKRCSEKFQWKSDTIQTTVYRDTTIKVLISHTDTVFKSGTITDTLIVHSGSAHGMTYIVHDTLKLFVWQTDSTAFIKLDSAIRENQVLVNQVTTIKEKAKLSTILWQVFGIITLILLIVLITRLFKKK